MSGVILKGDTSGDVTLSVPAVAGSNTITVPASTGTMALTSQLPTVTRFKNRIINGDMRIDQRNAGASVTLPNGALAYSFVTDRWGCSRANTATSTGQQSSTAPDGFINSLLITNGTGITVGSTEEGYLLQYVEGLNVADLGWGTAAAKTITLSFWVRSSITGTHSGAINNGSFNRSYPFSYTINAANTWEYETITIPGDTTGTWLKTNGRGMSITFNNGSGSTKLGPANTWAATSYYGVTGSVALNSVTGSTWYITGVQLEVGSSATGFEYVDYTAQLAMCQRYFVNIPANYETIAYYSDRPGNAMMFLPVTMRTSPTITGGSWTAHTGNAGTYGGTAATPNYFRQLNTANNWTTGAICTVASAVFASAEL